MRNNISLRTVITVLLLLLLVPLYIQEPHFLRKITSGIEDSKFTVRKLLKLAPQANPNVVVVEVDEKSINKLGRWPWNRKVMGDLIGALSAAKVVALDIVFSEAASPEEDDYLAEKIEDGDNVILGFFFRAVASESLSDEALGYLEECTLVRYDLQSSRVNLDSYGFAEANIPRIGQSSLSCAPFNTIADVDGLFRHYPVAFFHKGEIFPSLAVQALRYYLNKDVELILDDSGIKSLSLGTLQMRNSNYLKLNFLDDINRLSAYDLLSDKVDPAAFEDKVVFVGVTDIGIYDVRPTPIDTYTPGVYLHATAVSNVLDSLVLNASQRFDLLFIFFVLCLAFIASLPKKLTYRLGLYSLIGGGIIITINLLFIQMNRWGSLTFPLIALSSYALLFEFVLFRRKEKESLRVRKAFSSYVSPEIVQNIVKNPDDVKLGGEEREISVLFSDIRDFTTLSEKLAPAQLVYLLNNLLDPLTECILKNRGLLDKYIGDALMSLFNAPISIENHADMACLSALEMMEKVKEVNSKFRSEGLPEVKLGIGIDTGIATVGNMGSRLRFDYTAIGDTVNLSSRLEGLSKVYSADIIISESTKKKLVQDFLVRKLDCVRVKGKSVPINIYELCRDDERNRKVKASFEAGLIAYYGREFDKARAIFQSLRETFDDKTSYIFEERCLYYMDQPPQAEWDGVYTFKTK